ncbi:hypothetical protein [Saccharopolyspora pogona]|uniref:hypothetical protein n=1 Tax=Saccharopolyspora pogona TaxID=333966 RepID=UPI001687B0FB|nr:hypothetical protein [Saccharopolyspora pogona]
MAETPLESPFPLSSSWLGMNLLLINPELAIVDAAQHERVRLLESRGIEVVPHLLRHSRILGGGFHCATLDLVWDGGAIDYFS